MDTGGLEIGRETVENLDSLEKMPTLQRKPVGNAYSLLLIFLSKFQLFLSIASNSRQFMQNADES